MSDTSAPLHHVFVDFENIHHVDVSVIGAKSVNFTILLGANQTRLDVGLVEKLMPDASSGPCWARTPPKLMRSAWWNGFNRAGTSPSATRMS